LTFNKTEASIVQYGTKSGSYTNKTHGVISTYYESWDHNTVLESLDFDQTYYYVVGDGLGNSSQEFYFTTPAPFNQPRSFKFAAFGDMGIVNSEDTTMQLQSLLDDVDFYYHVGDLGYADDYLEYKYEDVWNEFQTQVEPISAYSAYMVCAGNHEATCHFDGGILDCPKELLNFTAYRNRFRMPSIESGSTAGNMWFSFNHSYVHFITIDTETDYTLSPEGRDTLWDSGPFGDQLAWLQADLKQANANRENQPWIIIIGHRPMYTSLADDVPIWAEAALRNAMEDLFYTYGVDLYIDGHVHSYERNWPVYKSAVEQKNYNNPKATVHVTIGNAGCPEGLSHVFDKDTPDWLAVRNSIDYGFGVVNVLNETALVWEMRFAANGSVADSFVLTKNH